jgi:phage recombination protein Bet
MPLGGKAQVELTLSMVRKFLCTPTKTGKLPTDADVVKYMMLCRARELDPWTGDSFLIGYDSQNGPQFSLITAVQALLKRAEVSPHFDGLEAGVLVRTGEGVEHRDGALVFDGEELLGGWARCHRKDRKIPFYAAVKFATFNTGRSQWTKDPAGMIVKCARAAALREAFPTQLAGLYTADEMGEISHERLANRSGGSQMSASSLNEVAADELVHVTDEAAAAVEAMDHPLTTFTESDLADFSAMLEDLSDASDIDEAVEAAMTKNRTAADRESLSNIAKRRHKSIRGSRSNKQNSLLEGQQP